MAEALSMSHARANGLLKDTIKRFQVYFPNYIEKTEVFEMRLGYSPLLSQKLRSLYIEKNIEFDKLGILNELGLKRKELDK